MSEQPKQTEHVDVTYVARLARLYLTDEEKSLFQGQLDQVLDYVKQLEALDVEGVEPTAHAHPVHNVLRKDEVKESLDREAVLSNAPRVRDHQFVVPKILE